MGRFAKSCSNVFHAELCEDEAKNVGNIRILKYKHLQAFKKMAIEKGWKPHKTKYVCNTCIESAGLKRDFTKYPPDSKEAEVLRTRSFASVTSFNHSPITCI